MHAPVFERMFPQSSFVMYSGDFFTGGSTGQRVQAAIVHCFPDEWLAVETARLLNRYQVPVIFYAERFPSAPFLAVQQRYRHGSLLLCPQSTAELSECAAQLAAGGQYVSRAVLRAGDRGGGSDGFDFDALSERELLVLFGLSTGRMAKETAALCDADVRTIEQCIGRLRKKCSCLSNESLLKSTFSWLSLRKHH